MAIFNGTPDPESILGTIEADTINGDGGDDTIDGWGGDDTITGDAGNDTIYGGAGNDSVDGGAGNDNIDGDFFSNGTGNDSLSGGDGNDTLNGGSGNDVLMPGLGQDVVFDGGGKGDLLVVDYTLSTTAVTMAAPTLLGPVTVGTQSPNGSNVSNVGGSTFDGGLTATWSLDRTQYETLFWTPLVIGAAMDGAMDAPGEMMSFASAVGNVLTYTGTTTVQTAGGPVSIFTKYVLTLQAGAQEWAPAGTFNVYGGGEYATQVDGATLEVNEQFLASTTVDGTYVAMSDLYASLQGTGGGVTSTSRGFFAFDDGGFTGAIEDGEGNHVGFNGMEKFDIRSGSGNDAITTAAGADTVRGGGGNDTLAGGGGNDSLFGGSGDDSIDGGTGADTLQGETGDDSYVVDDAGDSVVEVDGEGYDRVTAFLSHTLAASVESLTLAGSGDLAGTGNTLDNEITGNAGANTLTGAGGNDSLSGEGGNDTLVAGDGNDSVSGGEGDDSISSGRGGDTVAGGAGTADLLVVDYSLSTTAVTMAAPTADADGLTGFIADGEGNGIGFWEMERFDIRTGAGNDTVTAGGGNDSIDGGAGADAMQGGAGDDTYAVDDVGDTVVEAGGEGTDTVTASVSFTLGLAVENLVLAGSGNLGGTGNALANAITGNGVANRLSGGGGNDLLRGRAGADRLLGSGGDDTLNGAEGNDALTGGAGLDSMAGGLGNDAYSVDDAGDIVRELAHQGTDKVTTNLAAYTLGANLENLAGSSAQGQALTGNKAANVIIGAAGADTLSGMSGADTMNGGAGKDSLLGGGGDDALAGGRGRDVVTGGAGADRFVFLNADATSTAIDNVQDFRHAQGDKIDFSAWDANAGGVGVQSFKWAGTAAFHGTVGELRMAAITGGWQLQGDLDGDGSADFRINVHTPGTLELADLIGVTLG